MDPSIRIDDHELDGWRCVGCGRRVFSVKLHVPSLVKLPPGTPRGPYCGKCFGAVWPW